MQALYLSCFLLRTGEMKLHLRHRTPGMKLWTLGIDGSRKEQLALDTCNSRLSLTVNTATLTNGPTRFLEFAAQA